MEKYKYIVLKSNKEKIFTETYKQALKEFDEKKDIGIWDILEDNWAITVDDIQEENN